MMAIAVAAASVLPLASAKSSASRLHITAKTLELSGPAAQHKAGDVLAFYEADSGDASGHDHATCAVTNARGEALCHLEFVLAHGTIVLEGIIDLSRTTQRDVGSITGGTGRYAGASGTYIATGSPTDTKFALHFNTGGVS
jgi:hypothetical protein